MGQTQKFHKFLLPHFFPLSLNSMLLLKDFFSKLCLISTLRYGEGGVEIIKFENFCRGLIYFARDYLKKIEQKFRKKGESKVYLNIAVFTIRKRMLRTLHLKLIKKYTPGSK